MAAESRYTHVWAVVRFDEFLGEHATPEQRATVTKVVWGEPTAVAEVDRLNSLRQPGDLIKYHAQLTRLVRRPEDR